MPETITGAIDREALQSYVGRVLSLHEERRALNADIAEIYEQAKNAGFVTKIIRQIVREQQMEAEERSAHYALLDNYRGALGMLADLPLGEAAIERAEADRPRPFAEQPVHRTRRGPGRPRKTQPLEGAEAAGTA